MVPSAIHLHPPQRLSRPLFCIPNLTPSHLYSSSLPPSIILIHHSFLSPLIRLDGPRWFQLWEYNVSAFEPSLALKSLHGVLCHSLLLCDNTLHCLEEPCSRWMPRAPVLERGPVHRQHLLTDQIKHRLNLQIKSCRTNLFQTCFYSSKVNWHKGTVHFDYTILLRV